MGLVLGRRRHAGEEEAEVEPSYEEGFAIMRAERRRRRATEEAERRRIVRARQAEEDARAEQRRSAELLVWMIAPPPLPNGATLVPLRHGSHQEPAEELLAGIPSPPRRPPPRP